MSHGTDVKTEETFFYIQVGPLFADRLKENLKKNPETLKGCLLFSLSCLSVSVSVCVCMYVCVYMHMYFCKISQIYFMKASPLSEVI